jgi:FtsZ-binding cell division protein ZapB
MNIKQKNRNYFQMTYRDKAIDLLNMKLESCVEEIKDLQKEIWELKKAQKSTTPKKAGHNSSSKKDFELAYCKKCIQMTNHKEVNGKLICCKCSPS